MKNSSKNIFIVLMFLAVCTTSYYLDAGSFMNPQTGITCGSIIRSDSVGNQKIQYFDSSSSPSFPRRLLQNSNRYQAYYGTRNFYQNRYYNSISRMSEKDFWKSTNFIRQSNKSPEMQGMKNLYGALKIPLDQIQGYLIPYQNKLLLQIDRWFAQKLNPQNQPQSLLALKIKVQSLKDTTDYLTNQYLKGINIIIVGDGNRVDLKGKKIFIGANNMNVRASNTFVYNDGPKDFVEGENIVRTKRYEFNFNKIDQIQKGNPKNCIVPIF